MIKNELRVPLLINQKYPAPTANQKSILTSLLFGLFIGLFLVYFEPFNINLSEYDHKTLVLLFFGFITTSVLLVFQYLLPMIMPKVFSDTYWKIKHQILFYAIILFVIATLNGIYTNHINELDFSWSNYWWIINKTFVLGGIPITFITLIDYYQKVKSYTDQATHILKNKKVSINETDSIIHRFTTDLKNETVIFNEDDFNYAMAAGNYIDMYTLQEGEIKKTIYRTTLTSLENQIVSSSLKRCHRSYLVNLKKVDHISGNAQGLKLHFKHQKETIPVSRKYIPIIRNHFTEPS